MAVHHDHVRLLHDGSEAFPAMLRAIEGARYEVLVEMYWFASDRTGMRFAKALADKASAGLKVRVVYDAVGSLDADPAMFAAMRAAGCRVAEYNPVAPWRRRFRIGVVNNRDHRKMIVVDGKVGFVGGVNLGDEWAPLADGGEGWRDDAIRVEGSAARVMRTLFHYTWDRVAAGLAGDRENMPATKEGTHAASSPVSVLANHVRGERRVIRRAYLERIEAAHSSICITNSYFVPDRAIRHALFRAVDRGVDVRVLLPGESDVPAVFYAGRRLYPKLMGHGVQLHEWGGRVLHAKTAVIDREWCTVGTYNLDYRSLRFNLEVTVVVEDPAVAGAVADRFERDLEQAPRIQARELRHRPLSERMLEHFFYLFRKLL